MDKVEGVREAAALEREKEECLKMGEGLAEYNEKVQEKKEKIMAQILEMAKGGAKVSNREVAKKLGVARTSALRYLDELEKQGKLKQVGKTGVSVIYTLA